MNTASILNLKFQGIIKALIKFKAIQGFALNVQALVAGARIIDWYAAPDHQTAAETMCHAAIR